MPAFWSRGTASSTPIRAAAWRASRRWSRSGGGASRPPAPFPILTTFQPDTAAAMATILLQAAGAYLGGFLGSVGGAIGSAAGAIAGHMVDSALINGTRRIEGPRLTSARPFTAEEGAPIPRLYGTARLGGTLIWATRFEEALATSRQGKLGPKVTDYSYFVWVADLLCGG